MITKPDDPIHSVDLMSMHFYGLTKREYFAALAMQGMMANNSMMNAGGSIIITKSEMAEIAIISADALIEQLNK